MPAEALVVDASALGALVFNEPRAAAVASRLGGRELAAPTLLPYEMASICLKKIARHPERRDALIEAHALWQRLDLRLVGVDPHEMLLLAERSGLTPYDASYLWLAETLDAALVTLDAALAAVARSRRRRRAR